MVGPNLTALIPGVHLERDPTTGMIVLAADANAPVSGKGKHLI